MSSTGPRALALLILAGVVSCGTDGTPPLDAADVRREGRLLVNRFDPRSGGGSISVVRADGSGEQLLTDDGLSPSWTPDGRIIFASTRSGSQQIWIMDADGSRARQLTEVAPSVLPVMPQLGRNGLIVFQGRDESTEPDGNTGIWRMNEDGSGLSELTRGMQPFLAASGDWIAFTLQTDEPYHRQIWRINQDGTGLFQLTFLGDPDYPDANAPSISPDETMVAFFSGQESARMLPGAPPESIFDWGHRNVAIVPAEGGERTTLTRCHPVRTPEELAATSPETGDCVAADNPAWSPDGGWLVLDIGFSSGTQTWLVDVDGEGFQSFYPESRGVARVALRYSDGP
jgi:dipeptidyl aminopeptidase/acylaminoacyl peptidase